MPSARKETEKASDENASNTSTNNAQTQNQKEPSIFATLLKDVVHTALGVPVDKDQSKKQDDKAAAEKSEKMVKTKSNQPGMEKKIEPRPKEETATSEKARPQAKEPASAEERNTEAAVKKETPVMEKSTKVKADTEQSTISTRKLEPETVTPTATPAPQQTSATLEDPRNSEDALVDFGVESLKKAVAKIADGDQEKTDAAMNLFGADKDLPKKLAAVIDIVKNKFDPEIAKEIFATISEKYGKRRDAVDKIIDVLYGDEGKKLLSWRSPD